MISYMVDRQGYLIINREVGLMGRRDGGGARPGRRGGWAGPPRHLTGRCGVRAGQQGCSQHSWQDWTSCTSAGQTVRTRRLACRLRPLPRRWSARTSATLSTRPSRSSRVGGPGGGCPGLRRRHRGRQLHVRLGGERALPAAWPAVDPPSRRSPTPSPPPRPLHRLQLRQRGGLPAQVVRPHARGAGQGPGGLRVRACACAAGSEGLHALPGCAAKLCCCCCCLLHVLINPTIRTIRTTRLHAHPALHCAPL